MFRFFKKAKKLVFSFSYFQAAQYFRFRKQQAYVHPSAGIASFVLQIVLLISLIYQLVAVFSRSTVSVGSTNAYTYPPEASSLGQSNNFMVAFQIVSTNPGLNIKFYQTQQPKGSKTKTLLGQAQACTQSHWSLVSLSADDFTNRNMSNWLCMPKNINSILQGAKNTNKYSYLSIDIQCPSCSSNLDLIFHYTNAIINPSDNYNYINNYIDSDTTISLTNSTLHDSVSITMDGYSISSDQSFLPWYAYKNQQGIVASGASTQQTTTSTNSYSAQVVFTKSSKSTSYTRNFLKILDAFYFLIGSFAPTMLAFFFFIHPILSSIFQMRFATYVYRLEEGKKYGVLEFFKETYYTTFKKLCHLTGKRWLKWEKIVKARQILAKLMEVQYLYERVSFLQRAQRFLFKDQHMCGLRLIQKDSIVDGLQKYRKYKLRRTIKKFITSQHKRQLQELKIKDQKPLRNLKNKTIKKKNFDYDQSSPYPFKQSQDVRINTNKKFISNNQIEYQFDSQKHFQFNDSDYDSDPQYQNLEDHRDYYVKAIFDFKKLKREAESQSQNNRLSRMIYETLRSNDIQLMEQFQKRMGVHDPEQKAPAGRIQSMANYKVVGSFLGGGGGTENKLKQPPKQS